MAFGGKEQYFSDDEIAQCLIDHKGFVSKAAKHLGYAACTVRDRIHKSPFLKKTLTEIRESLLDSLETTLADAAAQAATDPRHFPALKFAMETVGHTRGYGTQAMRIIHQGDADNPVLIQHTAAIAKLNERLAKSVEMDDLLELSVDSGQLAIDDLSSARDIQSPVIRPDDLSTEQTT